MYMPSYKPALCIWDDRPIRIQKRARWKTYKEENISLASRVQWFVTIYKTSVDKQLKQHASHKIRSFFNLGQREKQNGKTKINPVNFRSLFFVCLFIWCALHKCYCSLNVFECARTPKPGRLHFSLGFHWGRSVISVNISCDFAHLYGANLPVNKQSLIMKVRNNKQTCIMEIHIIIKNGWNYAMQTIICNSDKFWNGLVN